MFWYGSTLIKAGQYNIIQFFVCLMAIVFGAQGAGQSFSFAPDMSQARSATIDVTRLLEHEPDIDVWSKRGRRLDSPLKGRIEFKDVYFCYPSRFYPCFVSLIRDPTKLSYEISPSKLSQSNTLLWLVLLGVASRLLRLSSRDSTILFPDRFL